MWEKILKWWMFKVNNPVIRKGEHGGFKWTFRRFNLTIETLSGNFKAVYTAAQHPYAYLLIGKDDNNIIGFAEMVYLVGFLATTDQGLTNDISKAIKKYQKRLDAQAASQLEEDETEEKIALDTEKAIQDFVELPKGERKKAERDINGRFRKAVKEAAKHGIPE